MPDISLSAWRGETKDAPFYPTVKGKPLVTGQPLTMVGFDLGACCQNCGALGRHTCVTRKPVLISGDYGALTMAKADFFSQRVEMSRHRSDL